MKRRPRGYYWVRFPDDPNPQKFTIGFYRAASKAYPWRWLVIGVTSLFRDTDFAEIIEEPITRASNQAWMEAYCRQ